MMPPKRKQRLALMITLILGAGIAAALILNAFNQNIVFFFSPSQVKAGEAPVDSNFRLGGLVQKGSMERMEDGLTVKFDLTDNNNSVEVIYTGLLPDLFREGQGVVALGKLNGKGEFMAEEVLAKHDENYMPPEVADMLNNSGRPYQMDTLKENVK